MKFNPNSGDGPLTLAYSTLLGGSANDGTTTPTNDGSVRVAVDAAGAAYLTGVTQSLDFPLVNAAQAVHATGPNCGLSGCREVFVAKIDAYSGSGPVTLGYSTYLGGTDNEYPGGIAVDASGAAYIAGETNTQAALYAGLSGTQFPLLNSFKSFTIDGYSEAFVAKFNPHDGMGALTLAWSSIVGGSLWDYASAIAVDSAGAVYVGGDASLLYSTCLGGAADEVSAAIAVGPDGAVHLAGQVRRETAAPYFPLVNAYSSTHSGEAGFVVRYNQAVLSIAKTHTGSFTQRQQNAAYTLTVSNAASAAGPTKGLVTVTETLPADIIFGAALGAAQLNASSSVPGAFLYTPAAGTALPVGAAQTLSAAFDPGAHRRHPDALAERGRCGRRSHSDKHGRNRRAESQADHRQDPDDLRRSPAPGARFARRGRQRHDRPYVPWLGRRRRFRRGSHRSGDLHRRFVQQHSSYRFALEEGDLHDSHSCLPICSRTGVRLGWTDPVPHRSDARRIARRDAHLHWNARERYRLGSLHQQRDDQPGGVR